MSKNIECSGIYLVKYSTQFKTVTKFMMSTIRDDSTIIFFTYSTNINFKIYRNSLLVYVSHMNCILRFFSTM